jgi:hypothetical protein
MAKPFLSSKPQRSNKSSEYGLSIQALVDFEHLRLDEQALLQSALESYEERFGPEHVLHFTRPTL